MADADAFPKRVVVLYMCAVVFVALFGHAVATGGSVRALVGYWCLFCWSLHPALNIHSEWQARVGR